jgi:prepilin-type N-terminal cleavage/methylation domain-containing protein
MGKSMKKYGNRHKGFTLIEMLVVVTIIAALIGIVSLSTILISKKGKISSWEQTMGNFQEAMLLAIANNPQEAVPSVANGMLVSDWLAGNGAEVARYLSNPIVNPFSKNPVYISGSTVIDPPGASSFTDVTSQTASTASKPDVILAVFTGATSGIVHFTIWYLLDGTVVPLRDSLNQT